MFAAGGKEVEPSGHETHSSLSGLANVCAGHSLQLVSDASATDPSGHSAEHTAAAHTASTSHNTFPCTGVVCFETLRYSRRLLQQCSLSDRAFPSKSLPITTLPEGVLRREKALGAPDWLQVPQVPFAIGFLRLGEDVSSVPPTVPSSRSLFTRFCFASSISASIIVLSLKATCVPLYLTNAFS